MNMFTTILVGGLAIGIPLLFFRSIEYFGKKFPRITDVLYSVFALSVAVAFYGFLFFMAGSIIKYIFKGHM